jgi:hypothetical protein
MKTSKLRYIFTWVALSVLLICSTLLVALAWNSRISASFSPTIITLLWLSISSSAIYLFLLAVKKAHRQWINEERQEQEERTIAEKERVSMKKPIAGKQQMDFASIARKLVRRIPEHIDIEELGKLLMKNLARELEIMSGVYYVEKNGTFEETATYALVSTEGQLSFKFGEGLCGQVARNRQLMVLTRLPEEYLAVYSGLGKAAPAYLAIAPLVYKNRTIALLEFTGYRYDAHEIENMLRIFSRDLMDKLALKLS